MPVEPRRTVSLNTDGGTAHVPVYSVRAAADRDVIARELGRGKVAAFYLGLFTIARALRPPWFDRDGGDLFWQVKPGRPRWSKLPLIIQPRHALRLIDFRLVHPEFRDLARRDRFEGLWTAHGAPLHVIAPIKQPLPFLHPAFQTSATDLRDQAGADHRAEDRLLTVTTASMFWMIDRDWDELGTLIGLYSRPRTFFGGTSFNEHGQHPPYTLAELQAFVERTGRIQFDLVIADDLMEAAGVFSSHTMVRLPLVGEAPELVIVRHGSVSAEWLRESTGYPVRVLASAGSASRIAGVSDADLRSRLEGFRTARVPGKAGRAG